MQRYSSLLTLVLFMFMLSWVAQAFQQEPLPFRGSYRNGSHDNNLSPQSRQELTPERFVRPDRNGVSMEQADSPESNSEVQIIVHDEQPLNNLISATEKEASTPRPTSDSIHFLLLGRPWDNEMVQFVLMVTLTRGSHSLLTAVDPAFPAELEGAALPLGELLQRGGSYDDLCRSAAIITGMEPQFYIDLNMHGFMEMLDLLGGIDYDVYSTLSTSEPSLVLNPDELGGENILRLLTEHNLSTAEKELLLVALLITARDIQHTTLGLSLLWTGYRNIQTNLGLNDLLELRRVTQGISPTRVSFREIRLPGP